MKSMLCRLSRYILLLFVSFSSLIAQGQNLSWDGEWSGMSAEGDARVSVLLNIESKDTLNPYNGESLCNGFISIMVKEPSGRESLLSTYELQLLNNNANQLEFAYSAGRPGMDQGVGKCVATQVNDTLRFQVTENNDGEAVLFEGIALTSDTVAVAADSEKSMPIMDIILAILAGGAYLAMLGHMVYVWIKGKRYKTKFNVAQIVQDRVAAGKPAESTEEENQETFECLEQAFNTWTLVQSEENGEEYRQPTKMKHIKLSAQLLDRAIALQSTDEDLVNRLNDLTEVINVNEQRRFDGSKALVWLGVILGVLGMFVFDPSFGFSILFSTGVYVVASRTPNFLIEKRQKRGGGNIHNGILAGVFAMIASAKTVRTIYKYDDGTKTYEDDHSQHWIAWILGLIVLITLAALMVFWAIINYLRNYIFYI